MVSDCSEIKKFESAMYYFDIVISDYYDTKYSDESKISYILIVSGVLPVPPK